MKQLHSRRRRQSFAPRPLARPRGRCRPLRTQGDAGGSICRRTWLSVNVRRVSRTVESRAIAVSRYVVFRAAKAAPVPPTFAKKLAPPSRIPAHCTFEKSSPAGLADATLLRPTPDFLPGLRGARADRASICAGLREPRDAKSTRASRFRGASVGSVESLRCTPYPRLRRTRTDTQHHGLRVDRGSRRCMPRDAVPTALSADGLESARVGLASRAEARCGLDRVAA